ncbi:MAG: leucine-rich repeat protein, partial [Clostridiales bacterium]|nr:leucine-rich repeat protein [Clostridiales bacterium]
MMKKKIIALMMAVILVISGSNFVYAESGVVTDDNVSGTDDSSEDKADDEDAEEAADIEGSADSNVDSFESSSEDELATEELLEIETTEELLSDTDENETAETEADDDTAGLSIQSLETLASESEDGDIPDYDIWMADSVLLGIDGSGSGLYSTFQGFSDPVYKELGGYLLDDTALVNVSAGWSVYFNSEYRDHIINEQKYIYEVLLMSYLIYDAESESTSLELFNRDERYYLKLCSLLKSELAGNTYDYIQEMTVEEAAELFEKADEFSGILDVVNEVKDLTDNAIDFTEAVAEYLALQEVKEESIALLKAARDACANMSSPNQDFIKAADEIIELMENTTLNYVLGKSIDYMWCSLMDAIWGLLSDNEVLKGLDLVTSGIDVLFDNTNVASDNLKLALLYTMDCYMKMGMMNAASEYLDNQTDSTAANTFLSCFSAYIEFQMYGNEYADTWLEEYLDSGYLANVINSVFFRENIETAKELIALADSQTANRETMLGLLDQYSNIYFSMYSDSEWMEYLNSNVSVTGICFSQPTISVPYTNETFFAYASVTPSNATNKNVTYTSSDSSILEVPENGGVSTIHGSGTVTITAITEDGGYTATQTVVIGDGVSRTTIASGTCGEDAYWSLYSDGTLYIYGSGATDSYASNTSVPWHSYERQIKIVYVGNGITALGDWLFYGCDSLVNVKMSGCDTLQSIGFATFSSCDSLPDISFPDGLISIGGCAFDDCDSLTSITIPESVTSIG